MSSRDKRPEDIIEESIKRSFEDLNQSKSRKETDGSYDIPRKKSSGKKTPQRNGQPRRDNQAQRENSSREEKSPRKASRQSGEKEASSKGGSKERRSEDASAKALSRREAREENRPPKRKARKKNSNPSSVSSDRDVSGMRRQEAREDVSDKRRKKKAYSEDKLRDRESEKLDETERVNDMDDFDDFDDRDEDKMSRRGRRKKKDKNKSKKAKKAALIAVGSVAGVLLAVYIGFAMYFNSHFMFFTEINGTDCSMKSVDQVEDEMKKKVGDYTLTLKESGGGTETIVGSDISIQYVPGGKLDEIVKEQNGFLWPKSLWDHPKIETEIGVQYDEAALGASIAALGCMNPEAQTPSVDAHPEFQEGQFVVVPEVVGTQINSEVFNAKVAEAINGFQPTLDLSETGCYALPRFVSDSPEVTAAAAAMNSYLGANITYDFNPNTEVVDSSVISQWVRVDGEMNVTFDEEAVRGYIQTLADKYNTKGVPRPFTTASGNVVTVEGGGFGWRIDQEAEFGALLANIQNAETVTREPNYSSRGISHGGTDVGSTYAEVDLTNQRMYFIKDGQVVLQSDCVTGNPNKGHATPQGYYSLAWKQKNRTLRGEKQPDGTYEYETPVAFWMPFNGGIGFHDATWQSSFGGRRYQTHGSHGCVNLPYSIAQQLYDLMYDGVPVICHY
ncbi:L,D-transpeptidase family protein [Lachnospiraceae bacterium WCA-9-b2]|uniref:L,D-transpeptidase family protein n=1 Tax=Sporofaciens musculi TaxID=2681861 RepID=A0A7X3MH98_9FIRM|nr:peptidoglycan binding domain-containing protein [Sporofaciens musculi]MCI9421735.1 L,D-transpeptidase family protein [Dorea sp.]MXP76410.1 L,D-transpeptidase family protein [Sporofaciens musculi]